MRRGCRFTVDLNAATNQIVGPAEYMRTGRWSKVVDRAFAGQSIVFEDSIRAGNSEDTAMAVALQMDYAEWVGMKQMMQW